LTVEKTKKVYRKHTVLRGLDLGKGGNIEESTAKRQTKNCKNLGRAEFFGANTLAEVLERDGERSDSEKRNGGCARKEPEKWKGKISRKKDARSKSELHGREKVAQQKLGGEGRQGDVGIGIGRGGGKKGEGCVACGVANKKYDRLVVMNGGRAKKSCPRFLPQGGLRRRNRDARGGGVCKKF